MPTETADRSSAESLLLIWSDLDFDERAGAFSLLSSEEQHTLFSELSPADRADILQRLPNGKAAVWMRFLPPDDAVDVLQAVDADERQRLHDMLDQSTRPEVDALLAYAEDEAGGLMSPRFVRVRPDVTADVAIRYIRQQSKTPEILYYVYVLDGAQRLEGVLSLRQLFGAPPDMLVANIMHRDPVAVNESTDQEQVARIIEHNNLLAVPVLDAEGRMKGIVTVDDIVDVIEEEATEDIQKLGGSEALGAPYLDVRYSTLIKKRGGWLSVLFLGEMLTATAMGYFEEEIAKAVVLAMFVPLVISSGGNSGSQAATLIVRSLAMHELRLHNWLRVLFREITAGATLGAWLGFIGFVRVVLWQHLGFFDYGQHSTLLAATMWLSLIGVVTFGTIAGSMLPFVLRRLGFDPATSSAPFVATLVDVTGLVIYFTVAAIVLRGTIL